MKYTGTIIGLEASEGSIYNITTIDKKCKAWKANVTAEIEGKMLSINFHWDRNRYECKLSLLKENYYTGEISAEGDEGKIFLWKFDYKNNLMFKGEFVEHEVGTYECFIELKLL